MVEKKKNRGRWSLTFPQTAQRERPGDAAQEFVYVARKRGERGALEAAVQLTGVPPGEGGRWGGRGKEEDVESQRGGRLEQWSGGSGAGEEEDFPRACCLRIAALFGAHNSLSDWTQTGAQPFAACPPSLPPSLARSLPSSSHSHGATRSPGGNSGRLASLPR